MFPDNAHGANRDLRLALNNAKMKQFWLLMQVVWNVPMGPNDDEHWLNMMLHLLGHMRKHWRADDAPLFQDSVVMMVNLLKQAGIYLPGEKSEEKEMWDYSMEHGLDRRGAGKVNGCRFQGSAHAAEVHLPMWLMDRFIRIASFFGTTKV